MYRRLYVRACVREAMHARTHARTDDCQTGGDEGPWADSIYDNYPPRALLACTPPATGIENLMKKGRGEGEEGEHYTHIVNTSSQNENDGIVSVRAAEGADVTCTHAHAQEGLPPSAGRVRRKGGGWGVHMINISGWAYVWNYERVHSGGKLLMNFGGMSYFGEPRAAIDTHGSGSREATGSLLGPLRAKTPLARRCARAQQ